MRFSRTAIHTAFGEEETWRAFPSVVYKNVTSPQRGCWSFSRRWSPCSSKRQRSCPACWLNRIPGKVCLPRSRVSAARSLCLIRLSFSFYFIVFYFSFREIYVKRAGYISKFQEKPGWWGSVEWDWQLTAGLAGDQGHRESWKDIKSVEAELSSNSVFVCWLFFFSPHQEEILFCRNL